MDTNQCQVCGNFFITLTSLNNHIETHSKKELYHCILGLRNTIAMLSRQPLPETTYQDNITATDLSQNHHAHTTSQPEKPTTSSAVLSIPSSSAAYEIHTGADGSQPGLMHMKTGALENSVPITPPNQNLVNSEPHATETGSSHHNAEPLQSVAAAGIGSMDSVHVEPTTADMLTCPICKKKLTSSYTLYRHMQSHYDKQADSCQVCGKEFVGKRSLVVHMRTHTGERPYKCNTCGKQFAQYGTLYRHRQIHNKGDAANNGQSATTATTSTATTVPSLPPPELAETAPMEDPTNQKQHLQQHHHHHHHVTSLKHLNNTTQSPATGGPNSGPENGQELSVEHRQERMGLPTVEHRESSEVLRPPEKTTILSVPSTENLTHDQQEMGESSAYPNTQHVSDTDAINNLLYQHVFGDQQQFLQGYLQNQLFAQTLARFPNWGSEFALMAGYPGYAGLDYKKPEQDQNYDMAALPNPQVEKARNNDPAAEQLHDTFSDNSVTSSKSERLESFSSLTESLLRRRNQSPVVTSVNSVVGPGIPSTSALPDPPSSSYPTTLGIQPPPPPSYEAAVQQSLGSPALLNTPVVESDQSQSSSSAAAVNMTVELSCKVCAQKFQTSAELTKHMSIHNEKNFVWCQVCHSKFTTPFSLRRHMKIHTGERDEVCGVCGKRFIDKPRLVVHMRTHTGEKPYACSICPKTFSRREVLKRHEKTHSTFKPVDASTPKSTYDELPRKQEVEVRKQETEHSQMDSGMYLTFDEDKVAMTTYLPSEQHHPPHPEHQDPENMSAVSEPENTANESRYMYTGEGIKSSTPPVNDVMYQHDDVPIMPQQEEVSAETSDVDQTSPKNPGSQQEQATDTPSDSGSGKEVEIDRDSRAMNEINDMLMRNFTSKVDGAKPYQCDVCNRKYTMQSCLRRHMLVHTGLKPNRCQVCGKSFVEKQQLLVHFRIHTGERPHQCSVCGKRFTQYGTLHNHMQVHRKQQYNQAVTTGQKSDDEGSSFIIKKELGEEEESLPKKSQELVNGESGPSDMESTAEQEIQSDLVVAKSPYTSDESRSVDISNKMRTNAGVTDESQNNLSEVGSEADGENSKAESVEKVGMHGGESESTDTNEKLDGTGAGGSKTDRPAYDFLYGYPTTSLMSLNLLANTSEVHQSLMEHMAQLQRAPEMHQGLLEYMAQLQRARMVGLTDYSTAFTRPPVSCTYTSSSDIGLNLTTSEHHAKVLGLSCDKCDAKFQDQETLESHMKTHALKNGNDAMLSQASSDATSPTKNDKFHTCKTCGKSFSASFCLRRHEMIHSGNKPYKCEYCPKAFVEKQHLTCHVRIHTGEKPYSCSTCGKAFTQYGTLHKHLRTHNKNKPHKCQFCEKAYYERRQLTNHLLTHFENKGK